jgi:hypothetical protein
MVTKLFTNFLAEPVEYARAEAYWRGRWDALVKFAGQEGEWQVPWLRTTFADGTPFYTGDPMFSAICRDRGLGVRVIQYEPRPDDEVEWDMWVEWFGEEAEDRVRTLVVSCALSEEAVSLVADAIYSWMTTGAVRLLRLFDGQPSTPPVVRLPGRMTKAIARRVRAPVFADSAPAETLR